MPGAIEPQVNGGVNNSLSGTLENGDVAIPVTQILCNFISTATSQSEQLLTKPLVDKLKELLLDHIGVGIAGSAWGDSSESIYGSITAFLDSISIGRSHSSELNGNHLGDCAVFTKEGLFPAPFAALLNATFAHTLDFDDTHAGGSLHPGSPVISAALAQFQVQSKGNVKAHGTQAGAASMSKTVSDQLTAILVGYEITVRLGMALGTGSYTRGFHSTSTAGIFGAIAAISVLKGLKTEVVLNAFGLAISHASGSMQYLHNGAWNKRTHPGWAAFNAFVCVSLAEGGVLGATEPIEGERGLLHSFTAKTCGTADLKAIVAGLGQEWHMLATSCKPWPSCRGTHCGIQLGTMVRDQHIEKYNRGVCLEEIEEIVLFMPESHVQLVGQPSANKRNPSNIVDAQFSSYYQVAVAILHGDRLSWSVYSHLEDAVAMDLARRIIIRGEKTYTRLENKISIRWKDGRREELTLKEPLGEPSCPLKYDFIKDKFLACVSPIFGEQQALEIMNVVENLETRSVSALMPLFKQQVHLDARQS